MKQEASIWLKRLGIEKGRDVTMNGLKELKEVLCEEKSRLKSMTPFLGLERSCVALMKVWTKKHSIVKELEQENERIHLLFDDDATSSNNLKIALNRLQKSWTNKMATMKAWMQET